MRGGEFGSGKAMVIAEEKNKIKSIVAMAQSTQLGMPGMTNPHGNVAFQAPKDTKKVNVDADFPDRDVIIGAGLGDK